jgi:hypothetical protein
MKSLFLSMLAVLCISTSFAQMTVVNFKKLQEFLPKGELTGFTRQKPTGSTQTVMNISTSYAEVNYVSPEDSLGATVTLRAKITDATFMPYSITALAMLQQNYQMESEDGYEKGLMVNEKYPGKMTVRSGDYKSCKIECGVVNRFYIEVETSETDNVVLLQKLIDLMPLDDLAKADFQKK